MKNECSIVEDLLPLYQERLVSPETAAFVEEHLRRCSECREVLEGMRSADSTDGTENQVRREEAAPLRRLKRRLRHRLLWTAGITAVVLALFLDCSTIFRSTAFFRCGAHHITILGRYPCWRMLAAPGRTGPLPSRPKAGGGGVF